MQLSIIIPTINRKIELEELLNSIQNYVINITFEVIIIDQNPSCFLDDIINKFKETLNISHHLVTFKGLSKAKNYGAKLAKGEYLTFPDDDCKVFHNTYAKALETIVSKKVDIVFGRCIDAEGNDSVLQFKKESYRLSKNNMLGGFVEATGVIHKSVFEKGFFYDENMGAGCFHGAQEGYDWLYRILTGSQIEVMYNPEVLFYHPQVLLDKGSIQALKRVFSYSCGTAYLCKKHQFYLKFFRRLTLVSFSIPLFFFINRKKAKYYSSEFLGLLSGYLID
jgi:glycosyltransferase involved in cell wall biosynthesis